MLIMFNSISDDPERESLSLRNGLITAGAVLHCAGKLDDLRDPSAVGLLFRFNRKSHYPSSSFF